MFGLKGSIGRYDEMNSYTSNITTGFLFGFQSKIEMFAEIQVMPFVDVNYCDYPVYFGFGSGVSLIGSKKEGLVNISPRLTGIVGSWIFLNGTYYFCTEKHQNWALSALGVIPIPIR